MRMVQPLNVPAAQDTDIRSFRTSLHMPRTVFARLIGRTERALSDWETGEKKPQDLGLQRVTELRRLVAALQILMPPDSVGSWLSAPNNIFGGLKPLEIIERGETDRLWRMIYELNSGEPA
jgi:hypothetical protein